MENAREAPGVKKHLKTSLLFTHTYYRDLNNNALFAREEYSNARTHEPRRVDHLPFRAGGGSQLVLFTHMYNYLLDTQKKRA